MTRHTLRLALSFALMWIISKMLPSVTRRDAEIRDKFGRLCERYGSEN